uniref:Uncharacterized protein n=1 Tax=Arundo donax TaxID=35708 RepID=A0A0A9H541_ARUDO
MKHPAHRQKKLTNESLPKDQHLNQGNPTRPECHINHHHLKPLTGEDQYLSQGHQWQGKC